MKCIRCEGDPQPSNFGRPRRCAFDAEGNFTPENWNCATISALLELIDPDLGTGAELVGDDESAQVVPVWLIADDADIGSYTNGWIVFTRYKQRGCTSSAVHVGDFWPARQLTLELAESVLKAKGK